jgi:carbonic anhydrase
MFKLIAGLHQFKTEIHANNEEFFDSLAKKQAPETLFIACSDSRIDPNLLTQARPGELFILRNAGNIVPILGPDTSGEEATIEFAIVSLGVKDIIICGHSQCGAMTGLLNDDLVKNMPAMQTWLKHAIETKQLIESSYKDLNHQSKLNIAVQENVLVQLEHLRTYPCVAKGLAQNKLAIHGWVYEIESGEVYIYESDYQQFLPLVYEDNHYHLNLSGISKVPIKT